MITLPGHKSQPTISLKALGKRRLVSPLVPQQNLDAETVEMTASTKNKRISLLAAPGGGAVKGAGLGGGGGGKEKVKETEKRVTRSSLGGNGAKGDGLDDRESPLPILHRENSTVSSL